MMKTTSHRFQKIVISSLLACCWMILPVHHIKAQPIQVLIHLQPNLPPYISQWEIDPNLTNIDLSGIIQQPQPIEVQVVVDEFTRGTILTASSVPIPTQPGPFQLRINNVEFLDWESVDYEDQFKQELGQTGRLPDGDYQICVYVRSIQNPEITLGESCTNFFIQSASPPVMVYPLEGMIVTEPVPLFQWSYSADGPGVSYKISIVEIYPGQHPQEAFETNHPVFEQNGISQTVFLFQQAEGILKPCNEYAVWVEVESSPGLHTSETGNYSEVIPFYWQTSGTSHISLSGPGGGCTGHVDSHPTSNEINFQWTATGPFSSFNIIVCPNPCGTYTPGPTTVSVGRPVEGEKITYSGPRHPFGTPELVLKPLPLASEVAEAITGSGIGLNDPVFITPTIQAQDNIHPCDPVTYTQTINFAGILEPGAAFTWYVIGTTPNGTTTTSDPYCDRFAPVTTGGGIPDNVACPGCAIKHKTNPGKPITIEFTAPATPVDTTRESPVIPLALLAWDTDDEIQICLCQGNYIEKKISVVDPVKYEWMLEGNGSLASSETPSNLYHPGALEVGSTASANITIRIKDMKANDPPAFASYDVEVKRINECQYMYTVTRSSTSEGGESTTPTGVAPLCLPQKEEWDPNPAITAFFTDEIHVGVGRRVLLRANGNDADQLKIICSGECGYAEEKIPENDELIYTWIATLGGFPDHGGTAITNSWNTSAIYKAPDTPGDGEIRLKVNDTGQAGDGSLNFVCMLLVGKVDLELEGVADETEDCNGRCLMVNQDDDNGNHVKDLDEKNVEHEDDLVSLKLTQQNCKGNITLSAVEGGDKIKIWTTQNKAEEFKLPKIYKPGDLPVTLWVEGILSSKKQNDIKLQMASDDPEHSDLVVMTAAVLDLDVNTNRDEVIDDKDDAKEGEDVDYLKTGALVLANLDDDAGESKTDTSDNVITSEKDFDDFSKMIVRKMVPPKDFHAQLTIRSGGEFIRVFKELKKGAVSIMGYEGRGKPVPLQYLIPDADLAKGDVEFFIEGIRPGKQAAIYLELANGDMILDVCEDSVKILVTPLIFHSNIRPTKRVFYAEWKGGHSNDKFTKVFKDESAKVVGAGNVIPLTEMKSGGIFAQDIFEIGFQQNPANHAGKPVTLPTVLDNPWQIHGFSHYPAESLLKPDFGLQRGESPLMSGSEYVDKIGGDYGGNLEVIPPFQPDLPYGQLVIGDNMEEQLRDFLIDQKVQAKKKKILVVLPVDPDKGSSVFHVDEVFNVVPAAGDKKFKVVVGDLDLAIALLKASTLATLKPLKDKYLSAKKEDVAAMKAIRDHLDKVKTVLKTDGDLADADIVPIPVLYPFEFTTGYGVPNAVNLQVVDSKIFIPMPIYDKTKDAVFQDMQKDIQKRLTAAGVAGNIIFVNTSQMSGSGGEAHCATNVERKIQ